MKKTLGCLKQRVQDFKINFKKKFKEYKKKPKSKRKSFIVGFTAAVGIFGLTKGNPKPTDLAPAPVQSIPPSSEIINASLSGSAASLCSLAITSGSFAIGVACGCLVVVGILHMQGK